MRASEYGGYSLLELNLQDRILLGEFHDKTTVGLGFGKSLKIEWQNAQMQTDFDEICKIAKKLNNNLK